jgi:ribose 5-phosphate isomerase B
MKLFVGSDHAGLELKNKLLLYLARHGYEAEAIDDKLLNSADDYPQYAFLATTKVLGEDDARAILLTDAGQGICIAANRIQGIRAVTVWNKDVARATRATADSNILCLPASLLGEQELYDITEVWLTTPFSRDAQHMRHIAAIEEVA